MERDEQIYEIRQKCDDGLIDLLAYLSTLPKDSKEYTDGIENFKKLYGIRLEQLKSDDDYQRLAEEIAKRQSDNEFKQAQMAQAHKEFLMKLLADIGTNAVKVGAYMIVGKWSAILESGGVIASGTAKNLIRNVQKFLDFNKY